MYSKNKLKQIWNNKFKKCHCGWKDCHPNNHRICYHCNQIIMFGAYWGNNSQRNSEYAWDVDHLIASSTGGSNKIENLVPSCIECNRKKGNKRYI